MHAWTDSVAFVGNASPSWGPLPVKPSHAPLWPSVKSPGIFFSDFHFFCPSLTNKTNPPPQPPSSMTHRWELDTRWHFTFTGEAEFSGCDKIPSGITQWDKEKTMIMMFIFTHPNGAVSKTRRLWNQFEIAAKPCNYYRRRRTEPHSTHYTETLRTICNSSPEK